MDGLINFLVDESTFRFISRVCISARALHTGASRRCIETESPSVRAYAARLRTGWNTSSFPTDSGERYVAQRMRLGLETKTFSSTRKLDQAIHMRTLTSADTDFFGQQL